MGCAEQSTPPPPLPLHIISYSHVAQMGLHLYTYCETLPLHSQCGGVSLQHQQVLRFVAFLLSLLDCKDMKGGRSKVGHVMSLDTLPLFLVRGLGGVPIEALPESRVVVVSLADRAATLGGGVPRPPSRQRTQPAPPPPPYDTASSRTPYI